MKLAAFLLLASVTIVTAQTPPSTLPPKLVSTPTPKPPPKPTPAVEKIPDLVTLSGATYKQARVGSVDPDGINYFFVGGVVKVPFTDLPEETRKKYGYDPQKAAAFAAADASFQQRAFDAAQRTNNAETQRKLDQLAGTQESIVPNKDTGKQVAGNAVKIMDPSVVGGLQRIVKMRVETLVESPFTAERALVEMTGISHIDMKEVEQGTYELTIWSDNYKMLYGTLPATEALLAKRSRTLFVSVSDPKGPKITIHGNATTYKGLSKMPTVIWSEPR